jgi:aspartate racemase
MTAKPGTITADRPVSVGTAKKSVGVIGGLGSAATAHFFHRVVRLTDAARDQDHVNLVVLNHADVPDRTEYLLGRSDDDPGPVLARAAQRLATWPVDLIVVPCNSAQPFVAQIADSVPVPIVSIVAATAQAVVERLPVARTVGLLATEGSIAAGIYSDALAEVGCATVVPGAAGQRIVNTIVYDQVKAGRPVDHHAFSGVVASLHDAGAQAVVLGCTELSVAYAGHLADPAVVDSLDVLARATITAAGCRVRAPTERAA